MSVSDALALTTVHLRLRDSPDAAAGRGPLRVDWAVTAAAGTQTGYELQAAAGPDFAGALIGTGQVEGDQQVEVSAPGGPLRSRERRYLRVRVRVDRAWSPWSAPVVAEAGLLRPDDWSAVAVTLPGDEGAARQSPAPLLRTEFALPEGRAAARVAGARLYATSLGVHELRLNGQRVGDHLLSPGWTVPGQRVLLPQRPPRRPRRRRPRPARPGPVPPGPGGRGRRADLAALA